MSDQVGNQNVGFLMTWLIYVCSSVLEKNLRLLMESVDEVSMDANKFVNYLRQFQKQNLAKQDYQRKRVRFHQHFTLKI